MYYVPMDSMTKWHIDVMFEWASVDYG